VKEDDINKLLSSLEGKSTEDVVADGMSKLASVPSGGGAHPSHLARIHRKRHCAISTSFYSIPQAAPCPLLLLAVVVAAMVATRAARRRKKKKKRKKRSANAL